MKTLIQIASLGLILASVGCIRYVRDGVQIDPLVAETNPKKSVPEPEIKRLTFQDWIEKASTGTNGTTKSTGGSVELFRTEAQAELMAVSDIDCKRYQAGVFGTQTGWNLGLGLGTAALTGASALLEGNAAKNLAGASAFLSTGRASINGEVYFNYVAPAVLAEINAIRADARRKIFAKRSCRIGSYPPVQAVNDALNYHETCSFITGLTSLLEKAGVQQRFGDENQSANAEQLGIQITKLKGEIEALTTLLADSATAAASKPAMSAKLAEKKQSLLGLEQISFYIGKPKPARTSLADGSYLGKIQAQEAKASLLTEAAANLPAGVEKVAAEKNRDDARKVLATLLSNRFTAEVLQRQLNGLRQQMLAKELTPAQLAQLQAEVTKKIDELVKIDASEYALEGNAWVDEGCIE